MRLSAGDRPLPGYRLDKFLGRGIYGDRWQATGPGGIALALKFLPLNSAQGMQQARAVQRLAQLRHANLVSIQGVWLLDATGHVVADVGEDQLMHTPIVETIVVATPLADRNLAERLEEYRQEGAEGIPAGELLQHMEDVARALDTLARNQIDLGGEGDVSTPLVCHGGIKPRNILLFGDSASVSDFGLSTALGQRCSTTVSTGAVAYLAPECMVEAAANPASDQYALAVCYTELRSGRVPVAEESTFVGALNQQQEGRLDLSDLPDAERGVIARATAAEPGDRFGSCLEMVRALQQVVEGFDVVSRPVPSPMSVAVPAVAVPVVASSAALPATAVPTETRSTDSLGSEVELSSEEEERPASALWVPLFVAACVGFAVYTTLQLSTLRSDLQQNAENIDQNADRFVGNDPAAVELDEDLTGEERAVELDAVESDTVADAADVSEAVAAATTDDDVQVTDVQAESSEAADELADASPVSNESNMLAKETESPATPHRTLKIPIEDARPAIPVVDPSADAVAKDILNDALELPSSDVATVKDRSSKKPSGSIAERVLDGEPASLLNREDIPKDLLELAGNGAAENAPRSLVAIFGEGNSVDTAQVVCAAQSHDGRLLASSVGNHRVRIWDVADRSVVYDLSGHDGSVYSMAFSPDSQLLATGGTTDHEVRLWHVEDGRELFLLSGHNGWVTALAFSPNGEVLATAGTDGNIMFWNTETGRLTKMIDGPEGRTIHALAFSPDGATLAAGGVDNRVTLREVATGLPLRELVGHEGPVRDVKFSADGSRLTSASQDQTVKIWDLSDAATEEVTLSSHGNWVRSVSYSRDSTRIASCGYDGKVHVHDATSGDLVETLEIHPPGDQVVQVMFSPTGKFLITVNGNGTVYVLRLEAE